MKISASKADDFARAPDPAVSAVLVYGPDNGLVRERAQSLMRSVVEDLSDPFRVADLSAGQLQSDPARLADEAAALALTGGRRVVRVREAADALAPLVEAVLAETAGEALLVFEAGDLMPRSSLRKLFEAAKNAAALPCYRDDDRSLARVIKDMLRAEEIDILPDALDYLAANLGGDRALTRRELEKLALFVGAKGPDNNTGESQGESKTGGVTLEQAQALIGDSSAAALDDIAYALADGKVAALERVLTRSLQEGSSEVAILRAAARHLQRLHLAAGQVASGQSATDAAKRLRPPVFWKRLPSFTAALGTWSPARLGRALDKLLEAEAACKQTGAPAAAIASRALLEIAANAPSKKGDRSHFR